MTASPIALVVLAGLGAGHAALSAEPPSAPIPHHPHDVVDDIDVTPDFPNDPRVFVASDGTMSLFLVSDNRGFSWSNGRPGMRGWAVLQVEVASDWRESRIAYALVGGAGLQRTLDGGATWHGLVRPDQARMLSLATAESGKPHHILIASPTAIWESIDGGRTVSRIGESALAGAGEITVIAAGPGLGDVPVFAGTADRRVFRRDRNGEWQSIEIPGTPRQFAFSPRFAEDGAMWIATHGAGVLRSTDGGATFRRSSSGIADVDVNGVAVPASYPECPHVFVATRNDGVYKSTDHGDNWTLTKLAIEKTDQTDNHFRKVVISPKYPEDPTVFCGSFEGLYLTMDGGERWFESNINPTRIGRKLALSPAFARDHTVFATTYGNPFLTSTDAGDTWEWRSNRFHSYSAYCIGVCPNYPEEKIILVGCTGGLSRSDDDGRTWTYFGLSPVMPRKRAPPEVRSIAFSPRFAADRTVFAVTVSGLYRSDDAGASWRGLEVPCEGTHHIALSPNWPDDETMFIGGDALHVSRDSGETWSEAKVRGYLRGFAVPADFATRGEAFAITGSALLRTDDHGATWTYHARAVDAYSPTVLRLSPDFVEDGTMYCATLSGGMFVSRDRGRSWARLIELGSPVDSCFALVLSPAFTEDRTMFAGTFDGFLRSRDGGSTWQELTDREFYDEDRPPWIARGPWQRYHHPNGNYCKRLRRGRVAGEEFTLPFTGTGVEVYAARGPDQGIAEIRIDGELSKTIDLYAPEPVTRVLVYENRELPWGFHDLTICATGNKNDASIDTWVSIDGAAVYYRNPGDRSAAVSADIERVLYEPDLTVQGR